MSAIVAVVSLLLAAAFVPVLGGVLFSLILLGVFGLALVSVLGGLEDRTVRQRDPVLDPARWRNGS